MSMFASTHAPAVVNAEDSAQSRELPQPQRGARERELLQVKPKTPNTLKCVFGMTL